MARGERGLRRRLTEEQSAHEGALAGASFVRHVAGPAWCIIVVDEAEMVRYFGPAEGYHGT